MYGAVVVNNSAPDRNRIRTDIIKTYVRTYVVVTESFCASTRCEPTSRVKLRIPLRSDCAEVLQMFVSQGVEVADSVLSMRRILSPNPHIPQVD